MSGPLLATKLHVPRRSRGVVARPRLSERLSRESVLTLVCAPAGFGKTTVLTEWLATHAADDAATAWLSLDRRDNDPAVFWAYVITALGRVVDGVGERALALLGAASSPIESVVATLLNDLAATEGDVVLVLDDYHVIESRDVQGSVAFLLDHVPAHVHVVVASRADPELPIARLRGRGELVELRAADLRFTKDETAAYLNEAMGLGIAAPDVDVLENRTEGWIAALQLAALSLEGRDDVGGFIAGFAGDDRYVVDYLVEEVLQRQPVPVRTFLLQTSVLGRLTGPLCDAVTGQEGGTAMLDRIDRGNLFVVPLDDRRRWYRYHHLFADMLRARLLDERPDSIAELHRRASEWWEQQGERSEAISHAMAGGDVERAADLIELAIPEMSRGRREATLRHWILALPDEVITVRPVLSVGHAAMSLVHGELGEVDRRLRDAERWLGTTADGPGASEPSTAMVVADAEAFRSLPSAIAVFRAAQAWILGDGAGAISNARRALDQADAEDHQRRGAAAGILGLAYWATGDLEQAHRWWVASQTSLEQAGYFSDMRGCAIAMADIRIAQGHLGDAMSTYERGLLGSAGPGTTAEPGPVLRGAADMHVGIAGLLRERNDLAAALAHLETSEALGQHLGLPQNPHRWCVALAGVREAQGDLDGAVALLDEAERLYNGDLFPDVRPIPALRTRVLLAQGRIAESLRWVRERGLSVDDELDYLRECEHITLVRVLLAEHEAERVERPLQDACRLLERLLRAADEGGRTGSMIEILALQAVARRTQGDVPASLDALRDALTLAEDEDYVRVFVDAGRRMASLLRAVATKGTAQEAYARRLLAALKATDDGRPATRGLIEPLSARELDVLRLLSTDLDGPAIARELFVSLNTMRTHTKSIFTKLGVNNRRAAVSRAAELDLLSRTRDR